MAIEQQSNSNLPMRWFLQNTPLISLFALTLPRDNSPLPAQAINALSAYRYLTLRQSALVLYGSDSQTDQVLAFRLMKRLLRDKFIRQFRFGKKNVYCLKLPRGFHHLEHDLTVNEALLPIYPEAVDKDFAFKRVRPDALFLIRGEPVLLELDMGTMRSRAFRKKIGHYQDIYTYREWTEFFDRAPRVLVVSLSQERRGFLERSAAMEEPDFALTFRTLEDIRREGRRTIQ